MNWKLLFMAAVATLFMQSSASAADVLPPVQVPEAGPGPTPKTTPESPSQPGAPPIPPSNIDPGIERRPLTTPDPRSAVPPPNIDPKMTIDPEAAPPASEALKPRGGTAPKAEPPGR
jgi:hypothetical protein